MRSWRAVAPAAAGFLPTPRCCLRLPRLIAAGLDLRLALCMRGTGACRCTRLKAEQVATLLRACGPRTIHASPLPLSLQIRAHWLSCRHLGEELLWEGIVQIPAVRTGGQGDGAGEAATPDCGRRSSPSPAFRAPLGSLDPPPRACFFLFLSSRRPRQVDEFMYRLAVVNEAREVLKWANERHTVVLPEGLEDGAIGGAAGVATATVMPLGGFCFDGSSSCQRVCTTAW